MIGARLGVALAQLGATVRERSLARTTPALVTQAVAIADAMAARRAAETERRLVGWLETYASASPLPPAVSGLFGALGRLGGFVAQQVFGTAIGFGVGGALTATLEPWFNDMTQAAWRANPSALLGVGTLADGVAKGWIEFERGREEALSQGFVTERFNRLVELARGRAQVGEVLALVNRGELTEAEAVEQLGRLGLHETDARRLLELRHVVPPPTDVVRFAVREVYNPQLAGLFGYAEEFPGAQALADAERAGITEDDLRKYWVAHWDLPSPTQLYEMFHRGLIDQATLELGLRAADFPTFWRDKLVNIAYLVPGRIDLRRMFEEGVIDQAEVLRGYLNLGYDPVNAQRLTEFAVALSAEPEKQLAKTEVTALYEGHHLNLEEARGLLADIGYTAEHADAILALTDARRTRGFRDRAVGTIRARFVGRKIDDGQASDLLDQLGLATAARDELVDLWTLEREATTADLTLAQWQEAVRRQLVTEEEFRAEAARRGYAANEVELLVALTAPRPRPA